MKSKGLGVALGLCVLLLAPGCLISAQEGERTHVDAAAPDEITFHFDTGFNTALVIGRSLALFAIALWAFSARKQFGIVLTLFLALPAIGFGGWWLVDGLAQMKSYRIEVTGDTIRFALPRHAARDIAWQEIEGIEVKGMASDVSFGDGKGQALKWSPQWEDLDIFLQNDEHFEVDLRPLSVEQRGTLWRAIVRQADLEGQIRYFPVSGS